MTTKAAAAAGMMLLTAAVQPSMQPLRVINGASAPLMQLWTAPCDTKQWTEHELKAPVAPMRQLELQLEAGCVLLTGRLTETGYVYGSIRVAAEGESVVVLKLPQQPGL